MNHDTIAVNDIAADAQVFLTNMGGAFQEKLVGQNDTLIHGQWKKMVKMISENIGISYFFA